MKIQSIQSYQIFDSRGVPTVETAITLEGGTIGIGIVPSGASTGQYEALELRDGDKSLYRGKSVFKAIGNVHNEIAPLLTGKSVFDLEAIDRLMIEADGTENKSRLGANAILSVSMAAANAGAAARGQLLFEYLGRGNGNLLPLPEIQIFGGGAHAEWRVDLQDFLVIATGAKSYEETLRITHDVYHAAGAIMKKLGRRMGLADEGGYWPIFSSHKEVFEIFVQAIQEAGYEPGRDAAISLDIAASDLNENGHYYLKLENQRYSRSAWVDMIVEWVEKYPIISIEDPMGDTDWEGWGMIYKAIGHKVQLIGDDLFTTNLKRIEEGVRRGVANAVLIKLNQIGTVTQTLAAIRRTQEAGWLPVVSARSGETEDAFIAHLAVATNAGQLKVGSFARSERMVKWNEVLRIQRRLGNRARFVGAQIYDSIRRDKTQN